MNNAVSQKFYAQWKSIVNWIDGNLSVLTDEELAQPLVSGKNHGVWLLGHLVESEDELSDYLGLAPMLFPQYEQLFGQGSALLPMEEYPSVAQLRAEWKQVVEKNRTVLATLTDEQWEEPHARMGQHPFTDSFKTKGNCFLTWNIHQAYHNGQLAMLLSRAGKSRF